MATTPGLDYAAAADYTVASGTTITKLITQVRAMLVLGWEPVGGVTWQAPNWYQALYKEGLQ